MADWREVSRREGWTAFSDSVRVTLGQRKHKIWVRDLGYVLEFFVMVPPVADKTHLVDLLVANRVAALAYWHVADGDAWAVSICPKAAGNRQMAAYMRDTAALADRLELQTSESDDH